MPTANCQPLIGQGAIREPTRLKPSRPAKRVPDQRCGTDREPTRPKVQPSVVLAACFAPPIRNARSASRQGRSRVTVRPGHKPHDQTPAGRRYGWGKAPPDPFRTYRQASSCPTTRDRRCGPAGARPSANWTGAEPDGTGPELDRTPEGVRS